jgi:serine protease Do
MGGPAASQPAPGVGLPASREEIRLSFAPLVQRVAPAVVNIYARKVVRRRESLSPLFNDPLFRQFFGENLLAPPAERVQNSLGSGVIVAASGLIMTNNHVIRDADEITVVLADRREFPAEIVFRDQRTDLAVVRIDTPGERLPSLQFGDSDSISVGDLVLAIGNPFGVGQTVTGGIVSALARSTGGVSDYEFFIQTDAAINPGNSGGALVNMAGELIGINTAIYSRSGGSIGIGFATPSNMARTILLAVERGGPLIRPWLGASGQAVNAEIAENLGLKRPVGVVVNGIYPRGPADRAGLEVGDVVIAASGREITDLQGLRYRIATQPLGGTLDLNVLRHGRERSVSLALEAPPEDPPREVTELSGRNPLAGATVANLSPAFNEETGLDPFVSGVAVIRLVPRSAALASGFRPGDIVLKVNDRDIARVADLRTALRGASDRWQIVFRRGPQVLRLAIGG